MAIVRVSVRVRAIFRVRVTTMTLVLFVLTAASSTDAAHRRYPRQCALSQLQSMPRRSVRRPHLLRQRLAQSVVVGKTAENCDSTEICNGLRQ